MRGRKRVVRGVVVVPVLGLVLLAFGTGRVSAQTPSWYPSFDQATAAARAWQAAPSYSSSTPNYVQRLSQGSTVWQQNQESMRQSLLMPRSGNYRTYATPSASRRSGVVRTRRASGGLLSRLLRRW